MGREDSMTVTGNRGSRVSWGGGGGRGNNGGGRRNRGRSPSTTVAYYRDGAPYNAAGEVIITITGGPKFPPGVPSPAPGNYQVPTGGGFIYEVAVNNHNIITGVTVYPVTNNRGYALANEEKRKDLARAFVDKILTPKRAAAEEAERKRKAAEEAARAQAEWDAAHPIEVAERLVNGVQQRINQVQQAKTNAELTIGVKETLVKQAESNLKVAEEKQDEFVIDNPPHEWGSGWSEQVDSLAKEVKNRENILSSVQGELNAARNSLSRYSQQLDQIRQEKNKAEAHLNTVRQKVEEDKKVSEENDAVKDAVKFTADFYKTVTEKYGEKSSKIAQELAEAAKGKQIRNVDEALKAFDKNKDMLNKKFSAKDREAIAKALEFVDRDLMAKNLAKFSKAFGLVGKAIDRIDVVKEINNGMETGNWRPLLVKLETLAAGRGATLLVAFTFGVMTASPLGILGFGLLMVITSTMINDELIEEINKYVLNL